MMQFSAIPLLPLLQYETIPFYHVYLVDYAAPETREVGEQAILRELEQLKDDSRKKKVLQNLELIKTTPNSTIILIYLIGKIIIFSGNLINVITIGIPYGFKFFNNLIIFWTVTIRGGRTTATIAVAIATIFINQGR